MSITTLFNGIEYRSRLEARWAAFFHQIGWIFTYEPFDGDGYIPDFLVHGDRPMLVEIKPAVTEADYYEPVDKIERGLTDWQHDVLIVGASPTTKALLNPGDGDVVAGALGEHRGDGGTRDWAPGAWSSCTQCGHLAVCHSLMSYTCRPCGHYDGNIAPPYEHQITMAWATATNHVKWRGRNA